MNWTKRIISFFAVILIYSCATAPLEKTLTMIPEKSLYEKHIEGAQAGEADDQVMIGICYEEGNGVTRDYEKALDWYKKAASKGNPSAYFRIGRFHEMGFAVEQSYENAREWYLSSAVNDYIPAIRKLIDLYSDDEEEQFRWIEKGMAAGDSYSTYRYGLIVERSDRDRALKFFGEAAETDDIDGSALIAILSLGGRLNIYTEEESLRLIEKSAGKGNARSSTFLGWLYEFGDLKDRDISLAFVLYEDAARWNNQLAIYNLSRFYGESIAVEGDPGRANELFNQLSIEIYSESYYDLLDYALIANKIDQLKILYRFKASQGDSDAMYQLGMLYPREDAFHWFWLAAQEGHLLSMVRLSKAYDDPVQSAAWLMVAENLGYEDDAYNSSELLVEMTESEKLEVSRLFTEIYYTEDRAEATDFLE